VFRAALQMPLSGIGCSLRSDGSSFSDQIIINAYILTHDQLSGIGCSLRSDGSSFSDQIIINAYILTHDQLSVICNAALNFIEFVIQ
jgi:hypothetical protein